MVAFVHKLESPQQNPPWASRRLLKLTIVTNRVKHHTNPFATTENQILPSFELIYEFRVHSRVEE